MDELSTSFTVVTYNLDGREHNYEERLAAFISQIKTHSPDVVVVQEGTRLTFEKLLRELGHLGYKRLLPDIMHHRQMGEMVFSKFPISETRYLSFKLASDNRGLTVIKIDVWGRKGIWIVTSQFDEKISMKRQQLNSIPALLRFIPPDDTVIFGGDTRILEYQDLSAPEGWYDAWYEAGSSEHKFTLDSETNLLANPPFKDRPDRVWFRLGSESGLYCSECKLFGYDSQTAISSHYGVIATFEFEDLVSDE